ncbi:Uncharacterised protein [uncultured Blautia sp.]|nr:Uncharacterised protein [uncultured Blautia sp.]
MSMRYSFSVVSTSWWWNSRSILARSEAVGAVSRSFAKSCQADWNWSASFWSLGRSIRVRFCAQRKAASPSMARRATNRSSRDSLLRSKTK